MKIKTSLKKICKYCKILYREKKLNRICPLRKHRGRQ